MRFVILSLVLLAAHFSLTAFAPALAGKSWVLWPFAADSQPSLAGIGGLPQQVGSVLSPVLAGIAGLGFLVAAFSLFGVIAPALWWRGLVVAASTASILLFVMFPSRWSVLPIGLDAVLIWIALARVGLLIRG